MSAHAESIAIEVPLRSKPVDFTAEIAPILRANCVACHHEKKASGNLNLESPQTIRQGGDQGPAVVPGKADHSLLLKVAAHQDDFVMPPPDNTVGANSLSPAQLGLLKLWIEQGAAGSPLTSREVRLQALPSGYQPAFAAAVTPDGQFAVCSRGNQLCVYHLIDGRLATMLADPALSARENSAAPRAHRDIIRCLAFNATGDRLASGAFREIKLWRRPRVTRRTEWAQNSIVRSIAVSHDGRWSAAGDEAGRVQVWDQSASQALHSIAAHQGSITGIVFSTDDTILFTISADKSLRAWRVGNGEPVGKAVELPSAIHAVALVKNGERIVTAHEDGAVRMWATHAIQDGTVDPAKPLVEIKAHSAAVQAVVAVSGEGKEFLSGGADGLVRRWNAENGQQVGELRHEGAVLALAARRDGSRLAAAGPSAVTLWAADGKSITQLKADPRVTAKLARMDAEITFAKTAISQAQQDLKSYEGLIRIAKVRMEDVKKAEEELVKAEKTRDEKKAALEKLKSENGKLEPAEKALADAETAVTVAQTVIDRAKAISTRTDQELADAEAAVAARETALKQLEAAKQQADTASKAVVPGFRSLAFSGGNSRLAVGCDDGCLHVLDAETGSWSESCAEHQSAIQSIAGTPSNTLVTGAADRRVLVWDASPDWRLERVIGGIEQPELLVDRVLSVDFSPDGQWLATSGGVPSRSGELKLWNVADGRLLREFQHAHGETVSAVRFSPDGRILASASGDRSIKLFDVQSGELVRRLAGHTGPVLSLSWKSDSKLLASSGADGVIKLWETDTGISPRTMRGGVFGNRTYKGPVTTIAFIGDSEEIVAASADATVRLHRTTSEHEVMTLAGSKGYQYSVAATPDGRAVIASSSDGLLRVWSGHQPQPKLQVKHPID